MSCRRSIFNFALPHPLNVVLHSHILYFIEWPLSIGKWNTAMFSPPPCERRIMLSPIHETNRELGPPFCHLSHASSTIWFLLWNNKWLLLDAHRHRCDFHHNFHHFLANLNWKQSNPIEKRSEIQLNFETWRHLFFNG
jgi:hypothetical protein